MAIIIRGSAPEAGEKIGRELTDHPASEVCFSNVSSLGMLACSHLIFVNNNVYRNDRTICKAALKLISIEI